MIALRRRPRLPEPAAPGTVALSARGLAVRREGRTVLSGIDLEVRHGEMLLLVGPNGAGKSTLLGALCGDIRPAEGRVTIAGRPLESWTARELAMRRAMLPQHHAVAFSFTVADIVRMGRSPWVGTPLEEEDEEAVQQAMREADIDAFADRPFTALSGGEQARAALARVLAQRTATLLLDEPTAALDIRHQELVFTVLTAQAAAGRAVVAVVHDLDLAATYADRVAVLSGGAVVACGPPAQVLTAPLLSEVYRHRIEVLPHPRTARPVILPER
ncbi:MULTISPECIES: heme ABC transporter ATP-binding protein [Thermomonospora]|uniref:ABC transporter related protein n=1 Tax=Thermomonospora curvata (strain ATCC 19995 / DSM 43183 / JCM 3096 / KCTC 9072 / NBRC 15933 / NCIMB 10081 / Henssen B9) TaxID=471852 RepID=D1ADH5_THECD|nr:MULTISPECIES: heme ABC transporter ATP-binding protein [Thermomonospora]ACY95685.1 ABC transporter related protein [Thermomonospora curvata DSM 43183]PKK16276.1 MAG: heme ABC transporter ATP-binding protein [Thermomonospora sp. CIF 1]